LFGEPGWQFTDEEPMTLLWYRAVADERDAITASVGTGG
jgi:hypothetical protein